MPETPVTATTARATKKAPKTPKMPKPLRDIAAWAESNGGRLVPGRESPICGKCELHKRGARTPFIEPAGADNPAITFLYEGPSGKEDDSGVIGLEGVPAFLRKVADKYAAETNITVDQFRYLPITRCAIRRTEGKGKIETGAKHCAQYLMEDLIDHPPRLIVTLGSKALGVVSHKSNAQDWAGKILTFRGWPDPWIIDKKLSVFGHPTFGPTPISELRTAIYPLLNPGQVYATRNPIDINRWHRQFKEALKLAVNGVPPKVYDYPWWRLTENPAEVIAALQSLIDNPGTVVSVDTETTGLRPFAGDRIVTIMLRWTDRTGQPIALGWPWDYGADLKPADADLDLVFAESALRPYIRQITPYLLLALKRSKLRGHNLTFDLGFFIATLEGGLQELDGLCDAFHQDTWHMRYTLRQEKGSIGLELLAYECAPELAGYEEDMTLLIKQHPALLSPKEGGHYANCPADKVQTHYKPYVLGDVEVTDRSADFLQEKLQQAKRYKIPLAHPTARGKFRYYEPVSRATVYSQIIAPAAGLLAKLSTRGMHVNLDELARQENVFPAMILDARRSLQAADPRLDRWVQANMAADPSWDFDLNKPEILKEALFKVLDLPVNLLTETGQKKFKSTAGIDKDQLIEYAATDKFSINSLAVTYPAVRPLLTFRTLNKAYTSYVRPMRGATDARIRDKPFTRVPLLTPDSRVHCQFKIAGTRTGRLAASNPNLQQLPRDGLIKKMYQSRFGERGCIYQADLSQIELRLLAAACGDPTMVKAYVDGVDLHSLTTSHVFKLPYEHFSKEYLRWLQENGRGNEVKGIEGSRKIGKTLNFLTGYGGGAYGFQSALALQGVYIELEECERHLAAFFETYPMLRTHIGLYKNFIQEHGLAVSITGRVRVLDEVRSEDPGLSNRALRAGYNHLIQSTASDMMLMSMLAIESLMREASLESILVSTVHDSLVIDAVRSELPQIHDIVDMVLNSMPQVLSELVGPEFDVSALQFVPLTGDASVGKTYYDETKIPPGAVDWDRINSLAFAA